jgi:hypothetical protein
MARLGYLNMAKLGKSAIAEQDYVSIVRQGKVTHARFGILDKLSVNKARVSKARLNKAAKQG